MNTFGERLSELIKSLNITKTAFAEKLNISQSYIPKIINKGNVPSDRLIEDICTKFNVSEQWLRTGELPMFNEEKEFDLSEYAKSHEASPLEMEIARIYFSLDTDIRQKALKDFVTKLRNIDIE